jgi:putative sterol carrier protein
MATQYHCLIANESIEVQQGKHAAPNITITMKESDYLNLVNGKLNGQTAFMTGKLKIAGDMGLALRLQSLFKPRGADSPQATNIQQVIDGTVENFNKDAAKGLTAIYQFDLID